MELRKRKQDLIEPIIKKKIGRKEKEEVEKIQSSKPALLNRNSKIIVK